jgi:hypothetical protein
MSSEQRTRDGSGRRDDDTTRPAEGTGNAAGDGTAEEDRVRDLELENLRLRRIVADRDLEIEMLREISRGTY